MEQPQSLQTIAEIGIAFAGFSGLVIAFRRKAGPLTAVHRYRLRILLTLAFGALFLALLPDVLASARIDPVTAWRVAAGIAALFSSVFLAWWCAVSRRMVRIVPEIFHRFAVIRIVTGHAMMALLLWAVACGPLEAQGAPVYLGALAWYLVHAAQQFWRMLFIQPRERQAQRTGRARRFRPCYSRRAASGREAVAARL
ncbi:MAG TPA: hypothetical protein VFY03_09210 [Woeseiaceae bacterium]|nr:hypothetical protein [Woeseiaceae bacterium]